MAILLVDAPQGAGEKLYLGFAKVNQVITKINAIEDGATTDQSGAEIKALLEALVDKLSIETGVKETAAMKILTSAERTKLAGIEAAATADQTGLEIVALLEALAGASRLDAVAIEIADAGSIITATEVEAALQEIMTDIITAQAAADAAQADVDGFDDELKNLIAHEIQQLETLGGVITVSAAQWGILGAAVEWTDWVPTLTGGADLSDYTTARYYRIGDICFFHFDALGKNVTTVGLIEVTMPFTCANTGTFIPSGQVHDGTSQIGQPYMAVNKNTNILYIAKDIFVGSWAGDETGVTIRVSGFFEIA